MTKTSSYRHSEAEGSEGGANDGDLTPSNSTDGAGADSLTLGPESTSQSGSLSANPQPDSLIIDVENHGPATAISSVLKIYEPDRSKPAFVFRSYSNPETNAAQLSGWAIGQPESSAVTTREVRREISTTATTTSSGSRTLSQPHMIESVMAGENVMAGGSSINQLKNPGDDHVIPSKSDINSKETDGQPTFVFRSRSSSIADASRFSGSNSSTNQGPIRGSPQSQSGDLLNRDRRLDEKQTTAGDHKLLSGTFEHSTTPSSVFTFRSLYNATPRASPEPGLEALHDLASPDSDYNLSPSPHSKAHVTSSIEPSTSDDTESEDDFDFDFDSKEISPSSARIHSVPAVPELHFTPPSRTATSNLKSIRSISEGLDGNEIRNDYFTFSRNGRPRPYDPMTESISEGPFFNETFQKALQTGMSIAEDVVIMLQDCIKSSDSLPELEKLCDDANALKKFRNVDTRTIAVLGDSGEGKSSLVNALLHCPDIALTGADGTACTSVITEYHHKRMEHTAPFHIEVEHLSEQEIREHVKELVWVYWRPNTIDPNTEDREKLADLEVFESQSEVAISTLQAIFGDRDGFQQAIENGGSGTHESLARKFLEWTEIIEMPVSATNGFMADTAESALEFHEKTKDFRSDELWPFTKVIRVFLNAQILKTGLIIADLPGLHDICLARVQASEQYLMKCDHILLVARTLRAVTNLSLKSSLFKVLEKHMPYEWEDDAARRLNVTVVCTHAEVHDEDEKSLSRKYCGEGGLIEQKRMTALQAQIKQARGVANRKVKEKLKFERKMLLMNARAQDVADKLKQNYAEKTKGGVLEVFSVANSYYSKFARRGNSRLVVASGIPSLRRRCHAVTAESQFLEAKNFLLSRIPGLLNSLLLWAEVVEKASSKDAVDWAKIDSIKLFRKGLEPKLRSSLKKALKEYETTIEEDLYRYFCMCDARREYLVADAMKQIGVTSGKELQWIDSRSGLSGIMVQIHSPGKRSTHHALATFNALCQHDGTWATAKTLNKTIHWNNELIWKMRAELTHSWDELVNEAPETLHNWVKTVQDELAVIPEIVAGESARFTLAIRHTLASFERNLRLIEMRFKDGIDHIRKKASGDGSSSYVFRAMTHSYREVQEDSGSGKGTRQRKVIRTGIESLFPTIIVFIRDDINKELDEIFHDTNALLKQLEKDVDFHIDSAITSTPEQDNWPNKAKREAAEILLSGGIIRSWEKRLEEVLTDITILSSEAER